MKQIKPYLFILVFLAIPLLLIPIIRTAKTSFIEETANKTQEARKPFGLLIHGGAGNIIKENIPKDLQTQYQNTLDSTLTLGYEAIEQGDSALLVVAKVIQLLEDCPLFNAGKGAVFAANGYNEMDASIMDGSTLKAGAVAGVRSVKNPIYAAKSVLYNSEHVLLSGIGADLFAKQQGLEIVEPQYFYTERQWQNHKSGLAKIEKHGTVGCVVLDKFGNLAAGTSTGGMTNKKYGRIGDSPIIGAGTYANNTTCAVSCTGHGEYFIRYCVAYTLSSRIELLQESIDQASHFIINKLSNVGGSGGLIALDKHGKYAIDFNTPGMFRGVYISGEKKSIALFE